jgi:hypothetical protein
MRNSFVTGILFLIASFVIPSCVEGSDGPSANDPRAVDTEGESMAGDEAAGSRELESADVAAPSPSITILGAWDCNADRLCLWSEQQFQGARLELVPFGCQNLGAYGFNNATSSWFNRWSGLWTLYTDGNCTGSRFQATDGQSAAQMSAFWDNNISSVCHGSGCP